MTDVRIMVLLRGTKRRPAMGGIVATNMAHFMANGLGMLFIVFLVWEPVGTLGLTCGRDLVISGDGTSCVPSNNVAAYAKG